MYFKAEDKASKFEDIANKRDDKRVKFISKFSKDNGGEIPAGVQSVL